MAKKDTVVKAGEGTVVIPDFLEEYADKGMEHITRDDLQMPRLALAQGLSPQMLPTDPLYIEGLKLGDAYNTVTGEIHGPGPWDIAVVRADPPRYMELIPMDEGGGVIDFSVPADDPRTQFTTDDDGKRVQPIATQFYDYVVALLETRETIGMSLKVTGIKVAKNLNTLIKLRKKLPDNNGVLRTPPMFMGRYKLRSVMETNKKGTFANFMFTNAGIITDEDTLKFLVNLFKQFKGKPLVIDMEGVTTGDTSPDGDM